MARGSGNAARFKIAAIKNSFLGAQMKVLYSLSLAPKVFVRDLRARQGGFLFQPS